jgi:hypothetical protein
MLLEDIANEISILCKRNLTNCRSQGEKIEQSDDPDTDVMSMLNPWFLCERRGIPLPKRQI